jgi:hypothetical protein
MTLKIEFIPASKEAELVVPMPKPAKLYVPEWYKEIPVSPKNISFRSPGDVGSQNIKACMPFLDAYTHGYIQETWTDIHIESSEDGSYVVDYNWSMGPQIIKHRENSSGFSISDIFYSTEFLWFEQWIPKMPDGYSLLYTSPLNYFDLPFRSLDAVIDSDKYHHEYSGLYPFYVNKGFSGVIPAGTPMYQIIPIKRNDWSSSAEKFNSDTNRKRQHLIRKKFVGAYKNIFWQKKNFT